MFKKSAIILTVFLLVAVNSTAQNRYVLDTSDPNERSCTPKSYTDLGNGIVRDNITGLEWERWGSSGSFTWLDARDYCSSLMLGGYTDWRLPSVEELATLMDAGSDAPEIDPVFFSYADVYWTATRYVHNTGLAYFVDFGSGVTNNDKTTNTFFVRGVRGATGGQQHSTTFRALFELDASVSSAVEGCSEDPDCALGGECVDDICVSSVSMPCSNDLDCALGEECVDDICVSSVSVPCSNDLDCATGEECVDDICVLSVGESCIDDLDCVLGEECIDDICVPLNGDPCIDDLDCAPGEECIADICVPQAGDPDRFTVNGDGTVIDNKTDLIWAHCAYGQTWDGLQCTGAPQILTWDAAVAHVVNLNTSEYLGFDDWRLSTKNELESLMDRTRSLPTTTFPGMGNGFYWSSTINVHDEVWAACFWYGNFHAQVPKTNNQFYTMRPVRGGMCRVDGAVCIDTNDCSDGTVCENGMCVESTCSLTVKHRKIRADKLFKSRRRTIHISGGEGFDLDGLVDPGPFTLRKDPVKKVKKNKLTLKVVVPDGLPAGTVKISVGDCVGEVVIQ